ncbi:MAG: ECF-type sigma factor [Planctomycetota bacterium]
MTAENSVTSWIRALKGGDDDAAALIWARFFDRVCGLARNRLRDLPTTASDPEDVALSAMNALCRGARDGRFRSLEDRSDLWDVIAMITIRKAIDARRKVHRSPDLRGGGAISLDSIADPESLDSAYVSDRCTTGEELLALLDDELRPVALLRLEGYSNEEIGEHIGRSEPTVRRYLRRIRLTWQEGTSLPAPPTDRLSGS